MPIAPFNPLARPDIPAAENFAQKKAGLAKARW